MTAGPTAEQLALIDDLMDGVRVAYPTADWMFARNLLTQAVVANDAFWRDVLGRYAALLRDRARRESVLAPGLLFAADALEAGVLKASGEET